MNKSENIWENNHQSINSKCIFPFKGLRSRARSLFNKDLEDILQDHDYNSNPCKEMKLIQMKESSKQINRKFEISNPKSSCNKLKKMLACKRLIFQPKKIKLMKYKLNSLKLLSNSPAHSKVKTIIEPEIFDCTLLPNLSNHICHTIKNLRKIFWTKNCANSIQEQEKKTAEQYFCKEIKTPPDIEYPKTHMEFSDSKLIDTIFKKNNYPSKLIYPYKKYQNNFSKIVKRKRFKNSSFLIKSFPPLLLHMGNMNDIHKVSIIKKSPFFPFNLFTNKKYSPKTKDKFEA